MIGALTGINSQGVVVGESGNDVKLETFNGFPWTLRLRYIMENSNGLQDAYNIMKTTNNTLGMNHIIASGKNQTDLDGKHPALEIETMRDYTAYYFDNDTRESDYIYVNQTTGQKYEMGWPMPEAVFRTNHAYDPKIRAVQVFPVTPTSDTIIRQKLFSTVFQWYESAQIEIGTLEAINVTSILGKKGTEDYFDCSKIQNAANVMSVTYAPLSNVAYVAYEDGLGSARVPACCSTYIEIDLANFF
eukprot:TRINITY_DN1466_c0_g1_i2.p1 TRINITY_DN1466_c0_g1~~TRINITY_DN1466_c0_g1_i2.p1  ORF type:complete len:245 (+),score=48.34 TRINITY_DN1466_c0_g1_i2:253-987(+)